ncbi:MAG: hypothetical protein ACI7YS_18365 [Flavobacterium sp.]
MSNTKYNLIWKEGSFFEKGHWRLVPDNSGGGILWLIGLFIIIFIICVVVLISPLLIALIGFSMTNRKRYYAGIASLIAILYLYVDYSKQWISGFIIFGQTNSDGKFSEGMLGLEYATYFYVLNGIALIISLYFIGYSYLLYRNDNGIENFDHEVDENMVSKKYLLIGVFVASLGLLMYLISNQKQNLNYANSSVKSISDTLNINSDTIKAKTVVEEEVPFDYSHLNDSLPKAKLIANKSYFYFTPDYKDRTFVYFKLKSEDMIVNYKDRRNGFIYVYSDNYSEWDDGWMLESDFELIDNNVSDENGSNYSDNVANANNDTNSTNESLNDRNEILDEGEFTVKVPFAYFYLMPNEEHKLSRYMTAGNRASYFAIKDGFVFTKWTNLNGSTTSGWLLISDVEIKK